MPWDIVKRNGKHCVADKNGKVLKCYAERSKAVAYQRALYANSGDEAKELMGLVEDVLESGHSTSRITKENGRYIIETVSTAALPDREDETFSIEAIDYDIQRAQETGQYPEYRVFHSPILGIGRVKEMRRIGIFAYDKGESYTDDFSLEVCEKMLLNNPDGKWRTSRGFRVEEVTGKCPQCGSALAITKEHIIMGFRCPTCGSVHLDYRGVLKSVHFKRARTFDITVTDVPAVPYTSASAYRTIDPMEMKEMTKTQLRKRLLDAGLDQETVDARLESMPEDRIKEFDDIPEATLLKEFEADAEDAEPAEAEVDFEDVADANLADDGVAEITIDALKELVADAAQAAVLEALDGFEIDLEGAPEVSKEMPELEQMHQDITELKEMVQALLDSDTERIKELASHAPRQARFRVTALKEGGKKSSMRKRHEEMMDEEEDEEDEEEAVNKEAPAFMDADGRVFTTGTDFLLER